MEQVYTLGYNNLNQSNELKGAIYVLLKYTKWRLVMYCAVLFYKRECISC